MDYLLNYLHSGNRNCSVLQNMLPTVNWPEKSDSSKKVAASKKARHFIASLKGRGIRLRGFSNRLRPSEGKKCRLLFFPLTFFLPQSFIIIN